MALLVENFQKNGNDDAYSYERVMQRLGNPEIIRAYGHNIPDQRRIQEALAYIVEQDYVGCLCREAERMTASGASGAAMHFDFRMNGTGVKPYNMTLFLAIGPGNDGKAMGTLMCADDAHGNLEEIVRFEAVPRN